MHRHQLVMVAVALVFVAACCASPAPAPTATPRPTAPPTSVPAAPTTAPAQPAQPPAAAAKTAGELATLGVAVYKKSCGRCHDDPFAGPLSNGLRDFRNAQELFRFMQTRMPQDAAGSLPAEEYFYVLADILVDGQVVQGNAVLDINKLADIVF